MSVQMPISSKSPAQTAAGMLAFLMSVIRCKESLDDTEEAAVRTVIADLGGVPSCNDRRLALVMSLDELRQRLHLPETTRVMGAEVSLDAGSFELFVSDPNLCPLPEGAHAPRVRMRDLDRYPSRAYDPNLQG